LSISSSAPPSDPRPGDTVIVGAGPAGLATAHGLRQRGRPCLVLEQGDGPGGLSRTLEHRGWRADLGGHRFFSRNRRIVELWQETLPPGEMLTRRRVSSIYYAGRFFGYPLRPAEVLRVLGPANAMRIGLSYLRRRLAPLRPEDRFDAWVRNRFGDRLYEIFFRDYTRKVWGRDPATIDAAWAMQRIRSLTLGGALRQALGIGPRQAATSLIGEFAYPRLGPGQMYQALAARVLAADGRIAYRHQVRRIHWQADGDPPGPRVVAVVSDTPDGPREHPCAALVSSMPLDELVAALEPAPPAAVLAAAQSLAYRSFVSVNLVYPRQPDRRDQWLYLNSDDVAAGRCQFYHNWSPDMAPPGNDGACLGFEYFCDQDDTTWAMPDPDLCRLAEADAARLPFLRGMRPVDGFVGRYAKAYPCYFDDYARAVAVIRDFLADFTNLIPVGRYGQFRYNNMDHAIETGLLAARRLHGEDVDPWAVNEEGLYHEQEDESSPC
jgi:protoporphyrinogen oxidase